MFLDILGIVIDKDGNYLSFGKNVFPLTENIFYHGRSFLLALKASGWLGRNHDFDELREYYPNLERFENWKPIDTDIYAYFDQFAYEGYLFLLNGSSMGLNILMGYLPKKFTIFQQETLLELKNLLYLANFSTTELYVTNSDQILTLPDVYQKIENNIKKRIREI